MNHINLDAYLEANEVLTIKIPEYLSKKSLKIILDFDYLLPSKKESSEEQQIIANFANNNQDLDWQKFIEETAGSIDDTSFFRHPQGEYEVRESLE